MKLAVCLLAAPVAGLVAPAAPARTATVLNAEMSKALPFLTAPKGLKGYIGEEAGFDPVGFAEIMDIKWMREAEIKHGRVAMLAFTGALVQSYGMHFPGTLNGEYYEAGVNPFEATPSAFATCPTGMAQILLFIGLTEGFTFPEGAWAGAMTRDAGDLGYRWDWANKNDLEAQKVTELKNGRAAMIGIMAFSAAHFIPGSVPFFFNA